MARRVLVGLARATDGLIDPSAFPVTIFAATARRNGDQNGSVSAIEGVFGGGSLE